MVLNELVLATYALSKLTIYDIKAIFLGYLHHVHIMT